MTHRELESLIAEYLERMGWLVIPTHDTRNHPVVKGVPDIIAIRWGWVVFIEVKVGRDKQSVDQLLFEQRALRAGARYVLAKSLEDVMFLAAA